MADVKTTKTRNIIPYFRKIVRNYSICFFRHFDFLVPVLSEFTAHRDTEKKIRKQIKNQKIKVQ